MSADKSFMLATAKPMPCACMLAALQTYTVSTVRGLEQQEPWNIILLASDMHIVPYGHPQMRRAAKIKAHCFQVEICCFAADICGN